MEKIEWQKGGGLFSVSWLFSKLAISIMWSIVILRSVSTRIETRDHENKDMANHNNNKGKNEPNCWLCLSALSTRVEMSKSKKKRWVAFLAVRRNQSTF